MHDIFLSYADEDRSRVSLLVDALQSYGWKVWWDRAIRLGQNFDQVIEDALDAAKCVVVVWSKASVASEWVRNEAYEGAQRGILIPVVIDAQVRIPLAFRRMQTAQLLNRQNVGPPEEFYKVVAAITHLIGAPRIVESSKPVSDSSQPEQAGLVETSNDGPSMTVGSSRIINSVNMGFALIPAGEFLMGSTDGYNHELPVHMVKISRSFYLGTCEVTQAQWWEVMENAPSHFTGDANLPVENVSWDDVQVFIHRLNERENHTQYRLPTEAEWEYAACAGSTMAYSFGDDRIRLGDYAWYAENSDGRSHVVGQLEPNIWGLYDMHGNVWEWVQDWYAEYPSGMLTDPDGPALGSFRVFRGGSWNNRARYCRSAFRDGDVPDHRGHDLGFRLLRTVS